MAMFMPDFSPIDVAAKLDAKTVWSQFSTVSESTIADLQTMTIPLANDRSTVLNQSVSNEFKVVQASNDKVGELNNAMQEIQKISPTGVNDSKQSNVDVSGYTSAPLRRSPSKRSTHCWRRKTRQERGDESLHLHVERKRGDDHWPWRAARRLRKSRRS